MTGGWSYKSVRGLISQIVSTWNAPTQREQHQSNVKRTNPTWNAPTQREMHLPTPLRRMAWNCRNCIFQQIYRKRKPATPGWTPNAASRWSNDSRVVPSRPQGAPKWTPGRHISLVLPQTCEANGVLTFAWKNCQSVPQPRSYQVFI